MYEELGATILCHDTRNSFLDKNKTVGSKLCRDRIQEKAQRTSRDRKLQVELEAATKTKDYVGT